MLFIVGLGPLLWLAKSAITPTADTLRTPMALFPHGVDWSIVSTAWSTVHIDVQFVNTIWVAAGSWACQIVVATTAGYALSVLRPKYGNVIYGLVLGTLFVPAVVLLVPLYLTILNPPLIGTSLINTFWAVWLPAGANAFNVVLVKRFFDNLPREVFEAARTDGAGPFRLFWSIVLPMSKPILGVVSVFAIIAAWKDYLWPMLVLQRPGHPAALGPPAEPAGGDRARRLPRRARDLDAHPDRAVPGVPGAVPAQRGPGRRRQGLIRRFRPGRAVTIGRCQRSPTFRAHAVAPAVAWRSCSLSSGADAARAAHRRRAGTRPAPSPSRRRSVPHRTRSTAYARGAPRVDDAAAEGREPSHAPPAGRRRRGPARVRRHATGWAA